MRCLVLEHEFSRNPVPLLPAWEAVAEAKPAEPASDEKPDDLQVSCVMGA